MATPTLYKFKPVFNKRNSDVTEKNDKTEEYIQLTDKKVIKDRCEVIDAYLTFSNSCGSSKQSNTTKVRRRL